MIVRFFWSYFAPLLVAGVVFGTGAVGDTKIRPMANPIVGEWENISRIKRKLPAAIDTIWFEKSSFSLIHVQISKGETPIARNQLRAWRNLMNESKSFWGEPDHPNAAQFFANQIYRQPEAYDQMLAPYIGEAMETGKSVETPFVWQLPAAKGNPHLFYHGQLTPRVAAVVARGKLQVGEEYVPLRKTRNDYYKAEKAEIMVVEVQTKRDAIDAAIDHADLPNWLKSKKFRYCVVMLARNGFARGDRTHVWLASPVNSGIDCDDILAGFGLRKS
ncbi:MAG: hypothetical protein JXR14_02365 [Paracoccaceae bacterium]